MSLSASSTTLALGIVYPLSAAFFWGAYVWLTVWFCESVLPLRYQEMNEFNRKCFRQNLLSGLHTVLSVMCLLGALINDADLYQGERRLYPHTSLLLYLDIAMSLGYFSFSLPISVVMAKAGFPYGSYMMIMHHALVFVAQLTFLLTQYPSGYMAASGFLFELTNVFFIPHVLMLQLQIGWTAVRTALGIGLFAVYTLARCLACSALAAASVGDLKAFAPPEPTGWVAACLGLACFYGLLLISWWWYFTAILPALHAKLQTYLGEFYYRACCPAPLRRIAWRMLTREGWQERARARQQFRVLQELRAEITLEEILSEDPPARLSSPEQR